jgi:hypothetical protein
MGFKVGDADFNDVTSGVGPVTHYNSADAAGAGLDDITIGGVYTGSVNKTVRVKIVSAGSPDKFQWSVDTGTESWNGVDTDINSSLGPQSLDDGVTVHFGAITDHTAGDYWTCSVNQVITEAAGGLSTPLKMAEIEVNHEGTGADNKARMIIRTNEGGTVGDTTIHADVSAAAVVTDMVSGGTYTGGPAPVTYYIKVTDHTGNPDEFAWSTDNQHYSDPIAMTGSAQTLEKGVTVNWDSIIIGRADGDIYKFIVGADTVQLHSNADFQCAGHVVSENGYIPKIFNSAGTVHLNAYS